MITIAVDVGVTGAIAFIDERGTAAVEDLPTIALEGNGMIRRRVDGRALSNLILRNTIPGEPVEAWMEQVGTMGGDRSGQAAQGSLMRSTGAIETVLEMLRMPPQYVVPRTWKRAFGLKSDKTEALGVARRLYPSTGVTRLPLQKHHNRAEALLIAHWAIIRKDLIG